MAKTSLKKCMYKNCHKKTQGYLVIGDLKWSYCPEHLKVIKNFLELGSWRDKWISIVQ